MKLKSKDLKAILAAQANTQVANLRSLLGPLFVRNCADPSMAIEEKWLWEPKFWKRVHKGKDSRGRTIRLFDHDYGIALHCVVRSDAADENVLSVDFHPGGIGLWGELLDPGYLAPYALAPEDYPNLKGVQYQAQATGLYPHPTFCTLSCDPLDAPKVDALLLLMKPPIDGTSTHPSGPGFWKVDCDCRGTADHFVETLDIMMGYAGAHKLP